MGREVDAGGVSATGARQFISRYQSALTTNDPELRLEVGYGAAMTVSCHSHDQHFLLWSGEAGVVCEAGHVEGDHLSSAPLGYCADRYARSGARIFQWQDANGGASSGGS